MKTSESIHIRSMRRLLEIEADAEKQFQDSIERNAQIISDAKQEADQIISKTQTKAEREGKKITEEIVKQAEMDTEQLTKHTNQKIQDLKKASAAHLDEAVDMLVSWVTAKGINS